MAQDKDQKNLNVPPLRFTGFTDEWKKTTLGEISKSISSGKSGNPIEDGEYELYGSTGIIGRTNSGDYVGEKILVARVGANAGKINYNNIQCGITDNTLIVQPKGISAKYVYYHLIHSNLKRLVFGSGQPLITGGMLKNLKINIPSSAECECIVKFLECIDSRIATQNKIIDNLQSLIKGLAKALTNQEEPNTRISDCLECHTSTLQESTLNENGLYPVYGASGIAGYLNDYRCDEDSILIIKDGSGAGTVSYATGIYSVIGTLNYLTTMVDYSLKYLYFCLMGFNFEPFKIGMAIPHIYFKDYGKAKIYCPTIEEQKRIAITLTAIENKLKIELKLLNILHMRKQHLLYRMFI